jgi:protein-arginine kinase activator protein McsA
MKPRRHNRRHLCQGCEQRRALFCIRGRWKADREHTLCQQCFNAELNRARARSQSA